MATRKAAGTAYPPPDTATGTLNIIAASGAAPVTMQNSTAGKPEGVFGERAVRPRRGGGVWIGNDSATCDLLLTGERQAGDPRSNARPWRVGESRIYRWTRGRVDRRAR